MHADDEQHQRHLAQSNAHNWPTSLKNRHHWPLPLYKNEYSLIAVHQNHSIPELRTQPEGQCNHPLCEQTAKATLAVHLEQGLIALIQQLDHQGDLNEKLKQRAPLLC